MKLTIEKNDLHRCLGRLQSIAEKRNTMPILSHALLTASGKGKSGKLELAATDLEVGNRSQVDAEVEKGGQVTVSARKLYDIVRELPSLPVNIELKDASHVEVRCGPSRFSLTGSDVENYPTLSDFKPGSTVEIQTSVFSEMITQSVYAASTDETRYNLNGVYFQVEENTRKISLAATDAHRLALVKRDIGADPSGLESGVIIPRKALTEIKRMVDEEGDDQLEIGFEGAEGLAKRGGVALTMRMIDGEFPKYDQVIPKDSTNRLVIECAQLGPALRRMVPLSPENSRLVRADISNGKLRLASSNMMQEEAEEDIEVDYKGDEVTIGLNAAYLQETISSFNSEAVSIEFKDGSTPIKMQPVTDGEVDEDTLAVIMPMRP